MSEKVTTFPYLEGSLIEGDPSFKPEGATGFAKEFRGDIYSSRGRFGNGSAYVDIGAEDIKSNNFVSGSAGWQIKYNGDVEFNEGIFRGSITVDSIHIPSATDVNSFHTDTDGNSWWGCSVADFESDNDNANAYVLKTGTAKFQDVSVVGTISGRSTGTIASAIDADGHFVDANLDTSGKEILGDFTFGESGAIKMITDENNGLWISPTGFLGKKAGDTTFSIDTSGNATFAGILSAPTGTLGKITSASLITGNLERNDFHWITFFESIDGYDTLGNVTLSSGKVEIETDATTDNYAYLLKSPTYNFDLLSWGKDRKIRTHIRFDDDTNQTIWIVSGDIGSGAHIGFKVANSNNLNGTVANGTSESMMSCGTISAGNSYSLDIKFFAGEKVVFYKDGVEQGEITTNLPDAEDGHSTRLIELYVKTLENVAKSIKLSFWDFWQAS